MMSNFSNLDDIFAPKGVLKEPEQAKMVMYSPSAKNTKNGKYTACVRFIPWHKDPNNSIVIKQHLRRNCRYKCISLRQNKM